MDIDTQNEYNEYSQVEIINRCKFGNNHIIQRKVWSDSFISQQHDQDETIESNW